MNGCLYCGPEEKDLRCRDSRNGYFCTRKKGHAGDHIACALMSPDPEDHDLKRWPQIYEDDDE